MADKEGFRRVAEWIRSDDQIKAIVLSAGGKAKGSKKVTDLLLDASQLIVKGESISKALNPFLERVISDAEAIGLVSLIKDELMTIGQEVEKDSSLDFILSRGEYFYAKLFAGYYGLPFIDSARLIGFYSNGRLNMGLSEFQIEKAYEKQGKFVCGGFYGSLSNGKIKTFTRGGSDFSGAIVARGIKAGEYLNFTDVDGIFPFLPTKENCLPIKEICFDTVRLLGEFGTTVLHPASVLPLYGTGTQITVKNTFNKCAQGTLIKEESNERPFAAAIKSECRFLKIIKRGKGYELYSRLVKEGGKIICGACSFDFVEICIEDDPQEMSLNAKDLDFCQIQEDVSVFYLTPCEKTAMSVKRLQSLQIALFIGVFDYGAYVAVKENYKNQAQKAIFEN
ncbi:MAG: hypothetical protein IKA61_02405 [Clostridia bacterium]|nr:hypothetical protein [Clostridia bacterium]